MASAAAMIAAQPPAARICLGGEVRVSARSVPVALDGLGVEADVHLELFGDALEQPARRPELVTDRDRVEHAHLELPLAHHDFSVRALDADAGAYAGQRVGFHNVASGHLRATDAAVVRTLGSGEAVLGPAVGPTVFEERVLLFDAELRLESGVLLGHRGRRGPLVRDVRRHVRVQDLAHDQYVVGAAKRIGNREDRHQYAVREVTRRLIRTRAVEAPYGRLLSHGDDLGFAAQLTGWLAAVNPDVFGLILQSRSL
jgi:hypothetical protein